MLMLMLRSDEVRIDVVKASFARAHPGLYDRALAAAGGVESVGLRKVTVRAGEVVTLGGIAGEGGRRGSVEKRLKGVGDAGNDLDATPIKLLRIFYGGRQLKNRETIPYGTTTKIEREER